MKITINAEKAAAIDAARAITPRDPVAELDALKAVLAKKAVVSVDEVAQELAVQQTAESLDAKA